MSATGRGTLRADADYYPTPPWVIRRALEALPLPDGQWVEPAAGDGAIVRVVRSLRPAVLLSACELRPGCMDDLFAAGAHEVHIGDFLATPAVPSFDVAILNPPYSLAEEFVRHCRSVARHTVALLRLNFLESDDRAEWLRSDPPDVYVLPNRPSFTGEGTDATAYAWMHWHGDGGRSAALRILRPTSLDERRANPRQLGLFGATP